MGFAVVSDLKHKQTEEEEGRNKFSIWYGSQLQLRFFSKNYMKRNLIFDFSAKCIKRWVHANIFNCSVLNCWSQTEPRFPPSSWMEIMNKLCCTFLRVVTIDDTNIKNPFHLRDVQITHSNNQFRWWNFPKMRTIANIHREIQTQSIDNIGLFIRKLCNNKNPNCSQIMRKWS